MAFGVQVDAFVASSVDFASLADSYFSYIHCRMRSSMDRALAVDICSCNRTLKVLARCNVAAGNIGAKSDASRAAELSSSTCS